MIENKIDVKKGDMTYSQRIEIGRIWERKDTLTEVELCKAMIDVLHPDTEYDIDEELVRYAYDIVHGMLHWIGVEQQLLAYKPTEDEIAAGIEQLSAAIKDIGVAYAMGERLSVDPDEVYQWKYSKVFTLLFVDAKRAEYARRLEEVRDRKRRRALKPRR